MVLEWKEPICRYTISKILLISCGQKFRSTDFGITFYRKLWTINHRFFVLFDKIYRPLRVQTMLTICVSFARFFAIEITNVQTHFIITLNPRVYYFSIRSELPQLIPLEIATAENPFLTLEFKIKIKKSANHLGVLWKFDWQFYSSHKSFEFYFSLNDMICKTVKLKFASHQRGLKLLHDKWYWRYVAAMMMMMIAQFVALTRCCIF